MERKTVIARLLQVANDLDALGEYGEADNITALAEEMIAKEAKESDGDPCWEGYEKVPGKKDYEEDSCRKKD